MYISVGSSQQQLQGHFEKNNGHAFPEGGFIVLSEEGFWHRVAIGLQLGCNWVAVTPSTSGHFMISLCQTKPPIWRRIETHNATMLAAKAMKDHATVIT